MCLTRLKFHVASSMSRRIQKLVIMILFLNQISGNLNKFRLIENEIVAGAHAVVDVIDEFFIKQNLTILISVMMPISERMRSVIDQVLINMSGAQKLHWNISIVMIYIMN